MRCTLGKILTIVTPRLKARAAGAKEDMIEKVRITPGLLASLASLLLDAFDLFQETFASKSGASELSRYPIWKISGYDIHMKALVNCDRSYDKLIASTAYSVC